MAEKINFTSLIGTQLKSLAVSNDGETTLRVESDNRYRPYLYFITEGDCCSESWWADITGAKSSYGKRITKVAVLEEVSPDDDRTRQDLDLVYGYELYTDAGVISLAFRNSSNGYYGGWCTGMYEDPLSGSAEYITVETDDWRA